RAGSHDFQEFSVSRGAHYSKTSDVHLPECRIENTFQRHGLFFGEWSEGFTPGGRWRGCNLLDRPPSREDARNRVHTHQSPFRGSLFFRELSIHIRWRDPSERFSGSYT